MDKQLLISNQNLMLKQKQLEDVINQVDKLEKIYSINKAEKESLDMEIKTTEDRLIRANQLTEGLAEEQVRWKEKIITLVKQHEMVFGDSLLTVSAISYYGAFDL